MAKSTALDTAILGLLFNATPITGLAQNGATPIGTLYAALHTADPGVGGNQNTTEVAYTGYARVGVPRTSSGFTVSGNSVVPVADIQFPAGTGGSGTATFMSIGTQQTLGAGIILYSGAINPAIVCGNGITPVVTRASTITES